MEKLATEAVEEATKEILDIFKREYVLKYVYIDNPREYERTNEFLNSFEWTTLRKISNVIVTEMFYNPDNLPTFNADKFQHGSRFSTPEDVRDNLMHILNKKGYSSSLWLSVYRDTPYWDEFIKDMFSGGELDKIITKHFVAKGFSKI